jgi:hypothetical protein
VKLDGDTKLFQAYWWADLGKAPSELAWTGSEYGVAWHYFGPGSSPVGTVKFARVSAAGAFISPVHVVAGSGTWVGKRIGLAWTGSEFGVDYQWMDQEIFFTRFSADGTALGTANISNIGDYGSDYPSLAWTGSEFNLGWNYNRLATNVGDFARVTAAGAKNGSTYQLTNSIKIPSLLWNGLDLTVAGDGYLTLASPAGVKIGPDYQIVTGSMAFTGSEYGVAYTSNTTGRYEIYFTRFTIDSDGDGLSDSVETTVTLTDPHDWDSDHDGTADGQEDSDGDGLANSYEVNTSHTNPLLADTDGDGLPDGWEQQYQSCGFNPLSSANEVA